MNNNIKLKAGGNNKRGPNEPIIGITGSGKYTYLWIGNNADNDKSCFSTLSGPATLLKLANGIIEGKKPLPEIKSLIKELSTKQTKSRRLK